MTKNRMELGTCGEQIAADALTAEGMQIVERNWRCSEGEIDIIARDGDELVVCEVKTRRGLGYGTPLESITRAKMHRLRRLAVRWAMAHDCCLPLRIDAIGVLLEGPEPVIHHVRGAAL